MQKNGKTKDCRPKEKDRAELNVVPVAGNHMRRRKSKLKRISQAKEKEISNRHKRTKG